MNTFIAQVETAADAPDLSAGIAEFLILAVVALSVAIFAAWFVFYRGPAALADAPPRRNRLPLYLPLLLFVAWVGLSVIAAFVIRSLLPKSLAAQDEFISYLAAALVEVLVAVAAVALAVLYFPRGLKGFGLDLRTIPRDLPAAFVNLIAVLPLVWLGVWAVDVLGKWLVGPDFQIQANEGLEALTENPEPLMRILMLAFVILVVPVFEEVLFRGMMQSTLRGYVRSPWLAILITSALFAAMHPWQHWLAIFLLSAGMGYAYERSASLFRPIFMHILFNATNVVAALLAN